MNIIKEFCKDRNIKIIDISHLDYKDMGKMMEGVLEKNNVMLVLDHNRTTKQVNNIIEMNEKNLMKNKIRLVYKEDFIYFDVNIITPKILTRWFDGLQNKTTNETCSICLECCKDINICCSTCLNVFHSDCMEKVLEKLNSGECPVCRSELVSEVFCM